MRLFKRRRKEPTDTEWVDLDRSSVNLNDASDVTSLVLTLAMKHGLVNMHWDEKSDAWELEVSGRTWYGETQRDVLERCMADLG